MRTWAISIAVGLCVAVFLAYYLFGIGKVSAMRRMTVTIRSQSFGVDVAETMFTRTRGLSGRASLAPDEGMLFLFPWAGKNGFWMKDMNVPIDILWIRSHELVGIERNVPVQSGANIWQFKTYYPPGPVDRVLELPAGTADRYGFAAGGRGGFASRRAGV